MKTCHVKAKICISDTVIKTKEWPKCDVMKTGHTRAWVTRQFNRCLKDLDNTGLEDKAVFAVWDAFYGPPCHSHISGRLAGNNNLIVRRGVFEGKK